MGATLAARFDVLASARVAIAIVLATGGCAATRPSANAECAAPPPQARSCWPHGRTCAPTQAAACASPSGATPPVATIEPVATNAADAGAPYASDTTAGFDALR